MSNDQNLVGSGIKANKCGHAPRRGGEGEEEEKELKC